MKQIFFTILLFLFVVSTISAQEKTNSDLNNKEQIRQPTDCETTYKDWIKKDVVYIISLEEKKAFNKLKTNEERENFIENFWRRRDPNPDTEENEFREKYYERIKYANENFESGIPGWKTDIGRFYITFGKPDKIEKGNSTFKENTNVPYENWFYEYIPRYCGSVEIIFTDPTQTNEFRISEPSGTKLVKALNECSEREKKAN